MTEQRMTKKLSSAEVKWLRPIVRGNAIEWPLSCEAHVTTAATIDWRKSRGTGTQCLLRAKVDFRGKKLCVPHAKTAALEELAGRLSEVQS